MRVLCIIYCYPPLLYPATMCYVKLVKGLKESGVDVEVVTVNPDSFYFPGGKMVDPTLESIVPSGVKNHQIWSWEGNPLVVRLGENKVSRSILTPLFEPRKREWTYPALRYLNRINLDRYDAIITCSQPHSNHLIGLELKKKTGKPWIAYLSDPWTDNVYGSCSSKRVFQYNLAIEQSVMEQADRVFFTSNETLDLVMKKYPSELREKCGILPHSFVPEWYEMCGLKANEKKEGVTILHTGHFYGPRSPMPLFRALDEVNKVERVGDRLHFIFCGSMAEDDVHYLRERGIDSVVTIVGTIPYLESLALMNHADYLLLIDAPVIAGQESVFLPSKLIDYLGSRRPVIGITPQQGTSARVLRETRNLVCDVSNPEQITKTLQDMIHGHLDIQPDRQAVDQYHVSSVSNILREALGIEV